MRKIWICAALLSSALARRPCDAQILGGVVKSGVLTDLSGLASGQTAPPWQEDQ